MKTIEDIARTAADSLSATFFASFGPALRDAMIRGVAKEGAPAAAAAAPKKASKANGKPAKERKERSSPSVLKEVVASVETSLAAWGADRLGVSDVAKLAETDKGLTSKALKKLFNEGKIAKEGKAKFTKYFIPGTDAPAAAAAE